MRAAVLSPGTDTRAGRMDHIERFTVRQVHGTLGGEFWVAYDNDVYDPSTDGPAIAAVGRTLDEIKAWIFGGIQCH